MMELHVHYGFDMGMMVRIYLFERDKDFHSKGSFRIYNFTDDGICRVTQKEYQDGYFDLSLIKPTFVLPPYEWQAMVQAFLKCAQSDGIKPLNESKIEGKLEAMTLHLDDMRKLVFK